jgi:hypothetical protein
MSVAGVALADGRLIWVETQHSVAPHDRVFLHVREEEVGGTVLVAPDQLVGLPPTPVGVIVSVLPRATFEPTCDVLPGSDLPALGTQATAGGIAGRVTALDPVARIVTITPIDGGDPTGVPAEAVYLE